MRASLVILFVLIVWLPLGLNVAGRDGGDPEGENRELVAFTGTNIGAWFNDHFGLRSTFVRWYGEAQLFVFGVSPSASVIKGRNGWFFYADDSAVEDYVS